MAANIEFTQGEDIVLNITLVDAVAAPIDITGDTFVGAIKDVDDLTVALGSFVCAIVSGPAGTLTAALTSVTTLAIPTTVQFSAKGAISTTPLRVLIYDIFRIRTAGDGSKRRVANGLVTVNPAVAYTGA